MMIQPFPDVTVFLFALTALHDLTLVGVQFSSRLLCDCFLPALSNDTQLAMVLTLATQSPVSVTLHQELCAESPCSFCLLPTNDCTSTASLGMFFYTN